MYLVAEALTHRLSELAAERLNGATEGGHIRLPYALARDVLDLIAEARDGPLDDGFRLDALLARIVAQLPPGELPDGLQDTDEGQPDGR
jgi:hypothetical protein